MNPESQRVAIAEACGWRKSTGRHPISGNNVTVWSDGKSSWDHARLPPDYLNDLNAMQSAVLAQDSYFQQEFHDSLLSLAGFPHQATSTQWAEIFVNIALRKGMIKS